MTTILKTLAKFCVITLVTTVKFIGIASLANEINTKEKEVLLWRVDPKPGSVYSTYILGSYHIGKDCQLQSRALESAFNDAEEIVFEVAPDKTTNFSVFNSFSIIDLIRQKGLPQNSKESLEKVLEPETYKLLEQKSKMIGFSVKYIAHLRPWVFVLFLQSLIESKTNYESECGIESILSNRLQAQIKKVSGLETASYQLELFFSLYEQLKLEDIIKSIELMVKIEDTAKLISEFTSRFEKQLDKTIDSIDSGNLQFLEGSVKSMCEKSPPNCNLLLTERNRNWLPKIEKFLTQDKDRLVVVGAAHLVGEDGIIKLLQDKGYVIRRIDNNY